MTLKPKRTLKLNAFLHDTGHHEASWRHPDSSAERIGDVSWYQEVARTAEAAKLDAVFFADIPAATTGGHRPSHQFEPVTLLSAIATATEKIGLIATASTSFYEPYNLARLFSSLDHISSGRAGWNIVTTFNTDAAHNFGLHEVPSNSERYGRAQEFVDVATQLWDSWEDDALVVDRTSGVFADPSLVHSIDHAGRNLRVAGPLTSSRSPQGRPVYIQAGSSNDGRAFAARNAEAIFTAHQTLADAQAFYSDIKSQATALGRNPDHVLVLPGISPFIADTEAEAKDLYEYFNSLIVPEYGLAQLEKMGGVSLRHLDLDERVPADAFGSAGSVLDNQRSRTQVIANIVDREQPTIRELLQRLAGGRGHNVVHGTPVQIADIITDWFENGAADGFNVMPPLYPQLLEAFTEKVVPILVERGLFRSEYEGSTLRDHYGLPRPESVFAEESAAQIS
ncbi:LLM class flavin-dependent oxidoreductase [Gordonia sp. HY002]|uniref:LLM class flavin-dependent oxidoreductase n=1 Tax=Gordonia zhenghanii TaxID=2911516 RepID=UPI001EF09260|nr:LLM class flavin-dependent oxidoreductase [Gordonia zhenghanii]MCF8571955.1 LLM class flavin-dependent oxidoreductase [Gordonia zhenghanii]MCF8604173.1 LLM class flavin-dependent oxidoreductase [Gordonia zhenghanii]